MLYKLLDGLNKQDNLEKWFKVTWGMLCTYLKTYSHLYELEGTVMEKGIMEDERCVKALVL